MKTAIKSKCLNSKKLNNERRKPWSDFIKTNGVYQSTTKVGGEMHAACFMYGKSWSYILFKEESTSLQIINSGYDFSKIDLIKRKANVPNIKLIQNSRYFQIKREYWEDGNFSFDASLLSEHSVHYNGLFRKDIISDEQELFLIGNDNSTDIYKFIEINDNFSLEYEILNLFSKNKFVKVNNGLPSFGQTDIEGLFTFEKLEKNRFILPSGTHHLDCYDYVRTTEGDKYFKELKSKLNNL